jgi:hypothetical protein
VSELLPDGIEDFRDLPHHVFMLIRRALVFLSFDELAEDERPARRLWLDDDGLDEHFKAVKKRRKDEFSGDRAPIEDPVSNDAAGLLIAE